MCLFYIHVKSNRNESIFALFALMLITSFLTIELVKRFFPFLCYSLIFRVKIKESSRQ